MVIGFFLTIWGEIMFALGGMDPIYAGNTLSSSEMTYALESFMVRNTYLTEDKHLVRVFYDSLS